jgi:hypothetical protein
VDYSLLFTCNVNSGDHQRRRRRRRKGSGRRLTCGGSLAATRRFGWCKRWRLMVVVAGRKKKKKICRGRGPVVVVAVRWLYWLPVVEMVAEMLAVMTVVAGMAERDRV